MKNWQIILIIALLLTGSAICNALNLKHHGAIVYAIFDWIFFISALYIGYIKFKNDPFKVFIYTGLYWIILFLLLSLFLI